MITIINVVYDSFEIVFFANRCFWCCYFLTCCQHQQSCPVLIKLKSGKCHSVRLSYIKNNKALLFSEHGHTPLCFCWASKGCHCMHEKAERSWKASKCVTCMCKLLSCKHGVKLLHLTSVQTSVHRCYLCYSVPFPLGVSIFLFGSQPKRNSIYFQRFVQKDVSFKILREKTNFIVGGVFELCKHCLYSPHSL